MLEIKDLDYYYNKFKYGEDTFHNLMKYKVKTILLVSTFYDAFILEQDGRLSEELFGEYKHLDLSNYPHIITVPTGELAIRELARKNFDLVITLENVGKLTSIDLAKFIKNAKPDLPIALLLNKTSNPVRYENDEEIIKLFDGIFNWEGDAKIFLTIIKVIEDRINLAYDTKNGLVRVILIYDKSIRYYSKFLTKIYYELVHHTQRLISEEYSDINKRLRMRARPKVVLTKNLNEAWQLYQEYKDYITCVISSSESAPANYNIPKWLKDEQKKASEGMTTLDFYQKIRENDKFKALMLHSTDMSLIKNSLHLKLHFLYDDSPTFWRDFKSFLYNTQGFGEFNFRNAKGKIFDTAKSMNEFEEKLPKINTESLRYHSENNHFSTWLVAHGEFQVARVIAGKQIDDFENIEKLRQYLIEVFRYVKEQKNRGKIVDFNPDSICDNKQIVRLSYGSLGGKGRGLAFLNALIETMEFDEMIPEMRIQIPCTAIIGTEEFDIFIEHNKLNLDFQNLSDNEIDTLFVKGELSAKLRERLKIYISKVNKPIAVRSSGLLEDSQSQPFAGIYRTFMLPNTHPDENVRLERLEKAIKLVFASIYSENTRNYIEGINYKIEEEKMAVILQTVVGVEVDNLYYPHFSGVAQSYNYYPTSYIKHQDGIVSLAVGLGKTVVDREMTLSFCPKYPKIDFMEPFKIVENSQKQFYAIKLNEHDFELINGENETLIKKRISNKEKEGPFINLSSIWDYENNTFLEGTYFSGPRVITFRSITHYSQYPLAEIINVLLDIGEKAMGIPVEIEFAVTLPDKSQQNNGQNNIPTFYLLQIRPLNVYKEMFDIDLNLFDKNKQLLFSNYALGNGLVNNVYDIIYLNLDVFDNSKTVTMRDEIDYLNNLMKKENRNYILIGPGRWGSSDPHLGIPVKWGQINKAKIIIEVGLKNFIVEASQGSHFFQNVFAMDVGYFTVPYYSDNDYIDWDWIKAQQTLNRTEHFVHIRSEKPFITRIDGRKGIAVIEKPL